MKLILELLTIVVSAIHIRRSKMDLRKELYGYLDNTDFNFNKSGDGELYTSIQLTNTIAVLVIDFDDKEPSLKSTT